jgi:glycosyltransferase involved in cell wall biosynthesis
MEGIPVALMEALACALPVVATSISGIPELVHPGETGLLVSPANADELADAIMIIYNNPEDAARLGASGRHLVLKEFSLQENVSRLLGLFSKSTLPETPLSDPVSISFEDSKLDRSALPRF